MAALQSSNSSGPRRQRIDPSQEGDLQYWSKVLGVTRQELVAAVRSVGDNVQEVSEYLATQSAQGPQS